MVVQVFVLGSKIIKERTSIEFLKNRIIGQKYTYSPWKNGHKYVFLPWKSGQKDD